jgi:hypothetical protein
LRAVWRSGFRSGSLSEFPCAGSGKIPERFSKNFFPKITLKIFKKLKWNFVPRFRGVGGIKIFYLIFLFPKNLFHGKKINRFVVDLSLVALAQESPFLCNSSFEHMSDYLFDYLLITHP